MRPYLRADIGAEPGLRLDLEEGRSEWVIGRDPDVSDFVIEDSTVSRRHARLFEEEGEIFLQNLSKVNPTLYNGEELEEAVPLKEGDQIQIGATLFSFVAAEAKKKKKKKRSFDAVFEDLEEEAPAESLEEPSEEKEEASAYDTIFEAGEEELPLYLAPDTPLLLKVISGPNAGAEIGLELGHSYTIGKDPQSCDIVFQDLSVSRTHARLTVSDEGVVELEDLGSKNGTLINNLLLTEKRVITPQDMIGVGTTLCFLIDKEAPQETIYSPLPTEAPVEPPAEEELSPLPDLEEKPETTQDWKKEAIPPRYLIAAASIAATFLIAFLSFFSLFKSKGVEISHKNPEKKIEEALVKFPAVQFSYNPASGKLFLVGHVLTSVDYQEMNYQISQIDAVSSTEEAVVIDELVWRTMNDLLASHSAWRSVSIHSPSPGKFVANGYLQTSEEGANLSDYLTVNFPYLNRLENRVVVEQNLATQLESFLTAKGFGGVKVQLSNGEVVLSGSYSNEREGDYTALLKEIQTTPGVVQVQNFALATDPNTVGIDITGTYQVGGASLFDGHGYSVVLNGKIFTLGDRVDGMKITSIGHEMILLEKDGVKYKIDYTP